MLSEEGNMANSVQNKLVRIGTLSRELDIPIGWLNKETEARRIPHLKADNVFLYDLDAVKKALLKRARKGGCSDGR